MDDIRNIKLGVEIPSEGYCDQPYIVIHPNRTWVAVLTTGKEEEGSHGQHVISIRSTNQGKTWSNPVDIEPSSGPEASWALPFCIPNGRIYVFYTYNADNMREVRANTSEASNRVDTLGRFAYRFSDDGGKTWSSDRYYVPLRSMAIDRENAYGGDVQFFWGVGKPILHHNRMYLGFSKVGILGETFIEKSEACFLSSPNILTESNPHRITWEVFPEGDYGLRAPKGPIAEESSIAGLSDGSLFATYRTIDGFPCHAYSRDGGKTWTDHEYMTYGPGQRTIKNPRAANFVWKASNGNFLYWFHNHGGKTYDSRNPAWICGGIERDGNIYWSQPEILLYDDQLGNRMSYPDLVEDQGTFYITETQKSIARVHQLDPQLIQGLWDQFTNTTTTTDQLALHCDGDQCMDNAPVSLPTLPVLSNREGFTLEFWVHFHTMKAYQILFDSRDENGKGILVYLNDRKQLALQLTGTLSDAPGGLVEGCGLHTACWDTDHGCIQPGQDHHLVWIVDGGPHIISVLVDGLLCDGGSTRPYGWSRFHPFLHDINGSSTGYMAPTLQGECKMFRLYAKAICSAEAVANYQAGI
jgi:hypothetical protein